LGLTLFSFLFIMNARWPKEYLNALRKEAYKCGNICVRLVRNMDALDVADDEFKLIEQRVLKPVLHVAEFCRVYNLRENSNAYRAISPYLVRKGNSVFLKGEDSLSENTRLFWKTSERLSGRILCCCKIQDLDLDSMSAIAWDPSAIRNPGAAFPRSLLTLAKKTTHENDRICFSFWGPDRIKNLIAFGSPKTLGFYFDAIIENGSFLRDVSWLSPRIT
jgi:hypothetical protein